MFGNLFIKPRNPKALLEFGQEIARELGLGVITERESSNYRDGVYLSAKCLGVGISLALTDDDNVAEYPFHMSMKADGFWVDDGHAFEWLADLLARKLTLEGYSVARCPDFGRMGAAVLRYSVKPGMRGNGRSEIEIVTNSPPTPESSSWGPQDPIHRHDAPETGG